jgi:hypothetical protein
MVYIRDTFVAIKMVNVLFHWCDRLVQELSGFRFDVSNLPDEEPCL